MGNALDIDMGGQTLIVKDVKTGFAPGQASNVRQTTAGGSSLTVTRAAHAGRIVLFDTAAGTTLTLPAATGTGDLYRFYVSVTASGGSHVLKVANASDTMVGYLMSTTTTGATTNGFSEAAGGTDDTITMNGTTSGGIIGSFIEATDIGANTWFVRGWLTASGTMITSLSATV